MSIISVLEDNATLVGIILFLILLWIYHTLKRDIQPERKAKFLAQITRRSDTENTPNIIIFLCDDLGYEDLSCFGAKLIQTQNIDALAEGGIKFTNSYASAPVCSPSRAGLLTGRYPVRAYVPTTLFRSYSPIDLVFSLFSYSYGMRGIAQDEILLPEILKRAGYSTGMIGKWHLGDRSPHLPNDLGFDFFYGAHYSNDMKPYHLWKNKTIDVKAPFDQNNLTKILNEQAIQFIKEHNKESFFLYYAEPLPHHPLHAGPDFRGTSQAGLYGDAVQEIDWSVGRIIQELKDQAIYEKTLIIFTSDNGPWHEGNPGYQRGRKRLPFEGGMKVPLIVSWPQQISAHQTNDAIIINIDILPTILALLQISIPADRIIDGRNIMENLIQGSNISPHDALYYFFDKKIQAIRIKNWKYHIKHTSDNSGYMFARPGPFLFDLANDPNESYDQSTHYPDIAKNLSQELKKMKQSLKTNLRGWLN